MARPTPTPASLEAFVDRMFDLVLEAPERAELIEWILAWEADNPDVDNAHRITGWIDVAYAFQARSIAASEVHDRVRLLTWSWPTWSLDSVTA